ncbi:MAG: hypothetical protein U1E87_05920 [Alphaproteobacteria bacterium]
MRPIYLLSCAELMAIQHVPGEPLLALDDAHLRRALRGLGAAPVLVDWEARPPHSLRDGLTLIRSPWNYHRKRAAFTTWLDEAEHEGIALLNPAPAVKRNMNKQYLIDLAAAGIDAVPTARIPYGALARLRVHAPPSPSGEYVLKPLVGASGEHTYRVRAHALAAPQELLEAFGAGDDFLLQPYLPEILTRGEVSLVYFAGAYSHAVLKRAADGEFRVQVEWGGSVEAFTATPLMIEAGAAALAALSSSGEDLPYGRVDGVLSGGRFLVMEVELVEPELFFAYSPEATRRFAQNLVARAKATA